MRVPAMLHRCCVEVEACGCDMHRIKCKLIKIERKLHHRRITADTFLLFSLCAVRSSMRCFRS